MMSAFGREGGRRNRPEAAEEVLMNKKRSFANAPKGGRIFIGPFFNRVMLMDFEEHRAVVAAHPCSRVSARSRSGSTWISCSR